MKTMTTLLVGLLLSLSLIAMTPTASAHPCTSSDDNCNQPCDDDGTDHNHNWRDSDGRYQSCNSSSDPPPKPGPTELPTPCDIYWLIYEIFDAKLALNSASKFGSSNAKAFELNTVRCSFAAAATA